MRAPILLNQVLHQLNLADIRTFVLIADEGSFTRAAEVLDVSRSHVSRQLSALEKQMGVTLMIRTTRSLKLTDSGKQFHQRAKKALLDLEQAVIGAVDNSEQVRGLIRVNCVGGPIGEELIGRMASEFMAAYQQVNIELDFSSHRVDLIQDEFDIAFRMGELSDAAFIGKKLTDLKLDTLASPALLQQYPSAENPAQLANMPCLTGSVRQWKFEQKNNPDQVMEVQVKGRFSCKNGRALVQSALDGNGVIRVPVMYCRQEIQQGKLVPVFSDWQIPLVPFYAIYHKDKYQPARLRAFIDFIVQQFHQL